MIINCLLGYQRDHLKGGRIFHTDTYIEHNNLPCCQESRIEHNAIQPHTVHSSRNHILKHQKTFPTFYQQRHSTYFPAATPKNHKPQKITKKWGSQAREVNSSCETIPAMTQEQKTLGKNENAVTFT